MAHLTEYVRRSDVGIIQAVCGECSQPVVGGLLGREGSRWVGLCHAGPKLTAILRRDLIAMARQGLL